MITHISVQSLLSGKKQSLSDGGGLILRRLPSGSAVWQVRKMIDGKRHVRTLGPYPDLGISEAREAAKLFTNEISAPGGGGQDNTVRGVFERWHARHAPQVKHPDEITKRLAGFLRFFGHVTFSELDPARVLQWFEHYTDNGTARLAGARKILGYVHTLEKVAISFGAAEYRRLEGLNSLIPAPAPRPLPSVQPRELDVVLGALMKADRRNCKMPDALLTGFYTLARPGEYSSMRWDWIDFDSMLLTIPADKMKMGKEHRVPVSRQLDALLRRRLECRTGDYVFSSYSDPKKPITRDSLSTWVRRRGLQDRFTPHGIRSVGRSWFAENGIGFEVAELCLAHEIGSNVERRYNRTDLLEKRRAAMQKWCDYVESQLP